MNIEKLRNKILRKLKIKVDNCRMLNCTAQEILLKTRKDSGQAGMTDWRRSAVLSVFLLIILATALMIGSTVYPAFAADDILTVTAVGDIMMGSTYPEPILPPEDGAGIFDAVKSHFGNSDIVFGNLEGPLLDSGKSEKCRPGSRLCYAFSTPTRYARYLKEAGFNVLNITNNHAFDFGNRGTRSTIEALDALSITSIGASRIGYLNIKGKKIAIVGFSFSTPPPYSVNDIEAAQEIVTDLKTDNDIVIVSFHGGAEGKAALVTPDAVEMFAGEIRGNCISFARAMIDAGADLVLGHGPHVLRPLEIYNDKLIVYSLGNFLTYGRFNLKEENGISMVLRANIDLATGDFAGGKVVPIRLAGKGIPQLDPDNQALKLIRELTKRDIGRGELMIAADGNLMKSAPEGQAFSKADSKCAADPVH